MQKINSRCAPNHIRATYRQQIDLFGQTFVLVLTTHRSAAKAAELYRVDSNGLEIFVKYASYDELKVFGIYDK